MILGHLTEEWRHAWKWLQVQLALASGMLAAAYGLTDFMQAFLPPKAYAAVVGLVSMANIYNAVRKKRKSRGRR